ncbi:YgiW/YdeI family stress tolerance OB fold protein [Aquitalea sp. LB_tupeE]|uniref:YgiW/YdeI family stress tolerance OB fold protein n=1 Tax=Aquitalea sp. LB_tupeE TaxID=2748078 RepID=UPI0015BC42F3|nr:NirD/YgiW/YdeI family stress tolerance protein [Aquitalea sp. LB_tupeE]NWK78468.1 NirD/YgiW/YdeI family stress tolerance protein [Aquitalea sp. LB_tupeE]
MKKTLSMLSIAALLPLSAHAEFIGDGSTPAITTVAKALQAADDSRVMLEGNIVRQIDHKHYEFKDASGSAKVEIDSKYLPAEKFTAQSKVRLQGKVDKEFTGSKIDVKQVEILK